MEMASMERKKLLPVQNLPKGSYLMRKMTLQKLRGENISFNFYDSKPSCIYMLAIFSVLYENCSNGFSDSIHIVVVMIAFSYQPVGGVAIKIADLIVFALCICKPQKKELK